MIVLGVNGLDDIFHDSSATLLVDGEIVASVEEERFNRRKHSDGLPLKAIEYCVRKAGLEFADINEVGYYLDPDTWLRARYEELRTRFRYIPRVVERIAKTTAESIRQVETKLRLAFPFTSDVRFHFLNHHLTHASSAFHISGFERAAVLTIDGSGERESSALYVGGPEGLRKLQDFLLFPESLGLIYNFVASHLGLGWVEGPGKLMGLAGYGTPHPKLFGDVIQLRDDCTRPIEVDLSFFDFLRLASNWSRWNEVRKDQDLAQDIMTKVANIPVTSLSDVGVKRLGEPRAANAPLTNRHCDIAASLQRTLEEAVVHLARQAGKLVRGERNLCLAGGVALNVGANRRVCDEHVFDKVFIVPAAYDGGTSLGCALYIDSLRSSRTNYAFDVFSGPDIERDFDIEEACVSFVDRIEWDLLTEEDLILRATHCLIGQQLIGWVQGRMESGPRALGNRSILANPTDPNVKDKLNTRVKKREGFRPYAPSVLQEECANWFDLYESPFMLLEAKVHPHKRSQVPGIVHVDGTSRPQTVREHSNPRYYRLIRSFFERTGIPMVLNTSFNRHGEPIVNRPEEAIAVLLETDLDALFIGRYSIRRKTTQGSDRDLYTVAEQPLVQR